MSSLTQRTIKNTFIELLTHRPLDKVTVVDIARTCGVNRNTFYYHFRDIDELLDSIFKEEEARLHSLAQEDFSTWRESFYEGIRWSLENKDAIENIYHSSCADRLSTFLFRAGRTSARRYIELQSRGLNVPRDTFEDAVHVLGATITGLVLEWLVNDLQGDPREFVMRAADLMEGSMRQALERSAY